MNLILYCGALPYKSLHLFTERYRNYQNAAGNLVKRGFLEDIRIQLPDRRTLRVLLPTEKAIYSGDYGQEFFSHQEMFAKNGRVKLRGLTSITSGEVSKYNRVMRILTTAECAAFFLAMYDTLDATFPGDRLFEILPGLKPSFWTNEESDEGILSGGMLDPDAFVFYTAGELKMGMDPYTARACASRTQAYLLYDHRLFSLFNMSWTKKQLVHDGREVDTRVRIRNVVTKMQEKGGSVRDDTVILLSGEKTSLSSLLLGSSKKKGAFHAFSLEDAYLFDRVAWYLPLSRFGAELLNVLLTKGATGALTDLFSQNARKNSGNIICDYEEDGVFVLSFLTPDLSRLRLFFRAAAFYSDRLFLIRCYTEYQTMLEVFLRSEGFSNVSIQCYSLREVKEALIERWKEERCVDQGLAVFGSTL